MKHNDLYTELIHLFPKTLNREETIAKNLFLTHLELGTTANTTIQDLVEYLLLLPNPDSYINSLSQDYDTKKITDTYNSHQSTTISFCLESYGRNTLIH